MRADPIELELDGVGYALTPSLRAGDRVNRRFGGFRPAVERLAVWDLDAATDIVLAGANLPTSARETVRAGLFAEGVANVSLTLSRFVAILASGGQEPREEGDDAPGKPDSRSDGQSSPSG